MSRSELQQAALDLPPRERQRLVDVLWQSLEQEPGAIPHWHRQVLDERLAQLKSHPEEGIPWEEVERQVWPED